MRISLRWKILFLTVLTPATLGVATLLTVNRNVTAHVDSSSIHESLTHSIAVFESMFKTRSRVLLGGAHVIARDPRFFSLLMLGPEQRDSRFVATVMGMAQDFNRITQTDLFEVVDRSGRMLASVGPVASSKAARDSLVRAALKGKAIEGVLLRGDVPYQVALTPALAGGRIVGVLLLGVEIGSELARELRAEMHCEVTFLSGSRVTGTSLDAPGDQGALMRSLQSLNLTPATDLAQLPVLKVLAPHGTYLTLVRRIPLSDPATQQLYVMQRSFDPETSFLSTMRRDMAVLALIALIAALVTGLLFSEQILRPIQSLVRGAQEMEEGNYDHPLRIKRRDEIGYLADRFVEMRQHEQVYLNSLQQAARLKSEFLSIASHELRTPIAVLTGYRDVLADGQLGPVTPQQAEALEAMRTSIERLTGVAEGAAHFARVNGERLTLNLQPCRIETVVRRAVAAARVAGTRRQVRIDVKCDAISGPVEADEESLEHAIFQLLTNGIRFTPEGGRVELRAQRLDGVLRIEIEDTGVGIEEGKLKAMVSHGLRVVEINNYRSATGLEFNAPGLGLGLQIARGIVAAHGGTLRAESRVGEGSTFIIEIPVKHEMEQAA